LKRENRLSAAFITSLVGGVLIFMGGLAIMLIGSYIEQYGLGGPVPQGVVFGPGMSMLAFGFSTMGLFGMMFGGVVIIAAVMLRRDPHRHATWGSLIILFSLFSIFGSAMGLGVGLILGLAGGILALTLTPSAP